MQSEPLGREEEPGHLPPWKGQGLRRIVAANFQETDNKHPLNSDPSGPTIDTNNTNEAIVECECCGMSEDCTPKYISRIREAFCGKWVCGLCAEAVREQQKKALPAVLAVDEALESHMSLCRKFNRTVKLNPKLSLAGAMRDIARKSFEHRNSSHSKGNSCGARVSTTISCGPVIN
ncbi:uncharacterized protein LOC109708231 isoform X1 [Ananas comosus]|uniref:Uncharacterized protein LOC109708231 isoform X1 n=1 Tax=Ananas comosus TaxID=4615 RepID=A0A6P5EPN4_ANACO|nr:uncharacterized protein LOC109708231 isoform X1 [Ananas comosus]